MENYSTTEVKYWLKTVLQDENVEDFFVKIVGNSGKGDGNSGEIIFVSLSPVKSDPPGRNYNFAIKRSKGFDAFGDNVPMAETYLNEMFLYEKVFPEFTHFQLQKGVADFFDSVPKCYGTLTDNKMMLFFENLGASGYRLWDKKKPLTRRHVEMVLGEYAKFHAVSLAMKDQQPEKFEELSGSMKDLFVQFYEATGLETSFANAIDEVCDLLQGELDETVLSRWRQLKQKLRYAVVELPGSMTDVKAILHGDCWCNNFLFKHINDDENLPSNVAILDWQITKFASPVIDLSYFLFANISKEDILSLENLLQYYHETLSERVGRLGSNLNQLYPYNKFSADWRKYCIYGLSFSSIVWKVCVTDRDEVVDAADKGEDFSRLFAYQVKDKSSFKDRARDIVKYAVDNDLV